MIVALAALTAFVASVIVHLCTTRVWPRQNKVFSFLISGFVVGLILLLILLKTRSRLDALEAALIYAFACELYIFLFTFVVTSISVAILVWLKQDGRLPESRIEAAQDHDDFVGGRINRMVESGVFQKENEQLSLTAKGRILLGAYKGLRSLFLPRKSLIFRSRTRLKHQKVAVDNMSRQAATPAAALSAIRKRKPVTNIVSLWRKLGLK